MVPLILKYLPDFCWQTNPEILTMLEQVDEDIIENSMSVTLCRLYDMGLIKKKRVLRVKQGFGKMVTMYIKG